MSNTNGVIAAPVSIYDVQDVLGQGSNDLATLCASTVINRWARYKPERWAGTTAAQKQKGIPQPIDYATRKINNFSLEVPYLITDQNKGWTHDVMAKRAYDIVYRIKHSTESKSEDQLAWQYLKPRGNYSQALNEFFRLSDFARLPNDTTDAYYGTTYAKGYNHAARVPFQSWMDMTGATEKERGLDIYYEFNKEVTDYITILFQNSIGDDLHLNDFISFSNPSGYAWRPVIQIFNMNMVGTEDRWYNRTTPNLQVVGSAITDEQSAVWRVQLPLSSFPNNAATFYHMCVGIGLTNDAGQFYGGDDLFLLPFTDEQDDLGLFPFYYMFAVTSHNAQKLNVTGLSFYNGNAWITCTGAPYFDAAVGNASRLLRITMNITRLTEKLYFIGENGEGNVPSGGRAIQIQAREMIGGVETTKYMVPQTSSWQNPADGYIEIPAGTTSQTYDIHANIYSGNIPAGGYAEYHLWVKVGSSDWDNIGYFSIHRTS